MPISTWYVQSVYLEVRYCGFAGLVFGGDVVRWEWSGDGDRGGVGMEMGSKGARMMMAGRDRER